MMLGHVAEIMNGAVARPLLSAANQACKFSFAVAAIGVMSAYSAFAATLPSDGLAMRLEADQGVELAADGTTVSFWLDQSGRNNNLTAVGAPQRVQGSPNNSYVIDLDGVDDLLQRGKGAGFPEVNADRTVILLANYRGTGFGGFSYGRSSCNKTFGTVSAPDGNLGVQGWCTANDFVSTYPAASGWLIQSAILASDQLTHYVDGALIDSVAHVFNTANLTTVLGAEIDLAPYVSMQVAAVLVYNRALTAQEHAEAIAYLQDKFINTLPPGC